MLELGFAHNSIFEIQGIDLNNNHSKNVLAYSSLFTSANFESYHWFLYLYANCSSDLPSNVLNILPGLGNLVVPLLRQVETQACSLLMNKPIFNS